MNTMRHPTLTVLFAIRAVFIFFLMLTLLQGSSYAEKLTVSQVVQKTLAENQQIKEARATYQAASARARSAHGIYDWTSTTSAGYITDRTPTNYTFFSSETEAYELTTGVRKKLPTGTDFELAWKTSRVQTNQATGPGSFISFNPYYQSGLSVSLRHSLFQNALGQMDFARVQLADWGAEAAQFQLRATEEQVVSEAVGAFWNVVRAQELYKIRLLFQEYARELEKGIEKNVKRGIAEDRDLYEIRSARIVQESEAKIALADVKGARFQLAAFIGEEGAVADLEYSLGGKFEKVDAPSEILKAEANNSHLKTMEHQFKSKLLEKWIAEQENNASLSLMWNATGNALRGGLTDTLSRSLQFQTPTYTMSLSYAFAPFSEKLAQSARAAEESAQGAGAKYVDFRAHLRADIAGWIERVNAFADAAADGKEAMKWAERKFDLDNKKFSSGRMPLQLLIRSGQDMLQTQITSLLYTIQYLEARRMLSARQHTLISQYVTVPERDK